MNSFPAPLKRFLPALIAITVMGSLLFFSLDSMDDQHAESQIEHARSSRSPAPSLDSRASPMIFTLTPVSGYPGSGHIVGGAGFGDGSGRIGFENGTGHIRWLDDIDDWKDGSISFTIPTDLALGYYTLIVEHKEGDNATRAFFGIFERPLITSITPEPVVATQGLRILGENLGNLPGRVFFYSPVNEPPEVAYVPGGADWDPSGINISRIPDHAAAGDVYVETDSGQRTNSISITLAGLPTIAGVLPGGKVYRGTEINITGKALGLQSDPFASNYSVWFQIESSSGEVDGFSETAGIDIMEWGVGGDGTSFVRVPVPYMAVSGKCKIIVEADGLLSEPHVITIGEDISISNPKDGQEVSGVVGVELNYRKGTQSIAVAIYPCSSGSSTGSPKAVFKKEIKVSSKSASTTVIWDTTAVDDDCEYTIYATSMGSYGSGSASLKVNVKQKPADIVAVLIVTTVSVGAAAGAGAATAAGAGAAGAGGGTAGAGAGGGGGGGNWFLRLIGWLRRVFGDVAEEKAEDLIEKGTEKIDKKLGEPGDVKQAVMAGILWKPFLISLGIAVLSFSLFINGGIFGWRGWWPQLPISFGIAIFLVSSVMAVKNLFGFWFASRTKLQRRWRMGIVGLFLLLVSGPLGSPMGEIGEFEDKKMHYSKRTRTGLRALSVMSTTLVLLSLLVLFGGLSLIDNGLVRYSVAFPGAFACIALSFFPLMPFKSSPGNSIWKWNRYANMGMMLIVLAILVSFSLRWIPNWFLIAIGGVSALFLLVLLFAFGILGDHPPPDEISARKQTMMLFCDDFDVRERARKDMISTMVKRPDALRKCVRDILRVESDSPEIREEILDLIYQGADIAPWLFIPYRAAMLEYREKASEREREKWREIALKLENRENTYMEITDESTREYFRKVLKPRDIDKKKADAVEDGTGVQDDELPPPELPPEDELEEPGKANGVDGLDGADEVSGEVLMPEEGEPEKICSECGAELSPLYRFCMVCGTKKEGKEQQNKKCPHCGTDRSDTDRFCMKCGKSCDELPGTEEPREPGAPAEPAEPEAPDEPGKPDRDDENAAPPPPEAPEPPEYQGSDDSPVSPEDEPPEVEVGTEVKVEDPDDDIAAMKPVDESFGRARKYSDESEEDGGEEEDIFDMGMTPLEPEAELKALPQAHTEGLEHSDEDLFDFGGTSQADEAGEEDEDEAGDAEGDGESDDLPPWLRK